MRRPVRGLARPARARRMRKGANATLERLGHALPLDVPVSSLPIADRQIADEPNVRSGG